MSASKKPEHPPKRRVGPLVTGAEIRLQLGIGDRAIGRWFATGLRVEKRDDNGHNPRVRIWDLVRWLHRDKSAGIDDPDLASAGGTSKALEKYRAEKARQAKRENDVAEGRLWDAEQTRADLREMSAALRVELEAIERVHGKPVGDSIREAIERAEAALRARIVEAQK
jgi:hypothetical protein